jgi:hypothetical protein
MKKAIGMKGERTKPTAAIPVHHDPGIDIEKALDILANRRTDARARSQALCYSCGLHQTESLRTIGQTIDMVEAESDTKEFPTPDQRGTESSQIRQDERRREMLSRVHEELRSMSIKELLQTVLDTQQQRVLTYRIYNE